MLAELTCEPDWWAAKPWPRCGWGRGPPCAANGRAMHGKPVRATALPPTACTAFPTAPAWGTDTRTRTHAPMHARARTHAHGHNAPPDLAAPGFLLDGGCGMRTLGPPGGCGWRNIVPGCRPRPRAVRRAAEGGERGWGGAGGDRGHVITPASPAPARRGVGRERRGLGVEEGEGAVDWGAHRHRRSAGGRPMPSSGRPSPPDRWGGPGTRPSSSPGRPSSPGLSR